MSLSPCDPGRPVKYHSGRMSFAKVLQFCLKHLLRPFELLPVLHGLGPARRSGRSQACERSGDCYRAQTARALWAMLPPCRDLLPPCQFGSGTSSVRAGFADEPDDHIRSGITRAPLDLAIEVLERIRNRYDHDGAIRSPLDDRFRRMVRPSGTGAPGARQVGAGPIWAPAWSI